MCSCWAYARAGKVSQIFIAIFKKVFKSTRSFQFTLSYKNYLDSLCFRVKVVWTNLLKSSRSSVRQQGKKLNAWTQITQSLSSHKSKHTHGTRYSTKGCRQKLLIWSLGYSSTPQIWDALLWRHLFTHSLMSFEILILAFQMAAFCHHFSISSLTNLKESHQTLSRNWFQNMQRSNAPMLDCEMTAPWDWNLWLQLCISPGMFDDLRHASLLLKMQGYVLVRQCDLCSWVVYVAVTCNGTPLPTNWRLLEIAIVDLVICYRAVWMYLW